MFECLQPLTSCHPSKFFYSARDVTRLIPFRYSQLIQGGGEKGGPPAYSGQGKSLSTRGKKLSKEKKYFCLTLREMEQLIVRPIK